MENTFDFLAIGDIVTDAFIRLRDAEVKECVDHHREELSLSFGDKVPYEFVKVIKGVGNSANAAVSAARLGLRAALVADVGSDHNGKECMGALDENKVSVDYVRINQDMESNYHYVLWYGVERTILVKHQKYPYKFPELKDAPKWIYLSSLGEDSLDYHHQISQYLAAHPDIKLAFQPGTFQINFGTDIIKDIYKRSDIFFCNVEEAQKILKQPSSEKKSDRKEVVKQLMKDMAALGPKIVVITDGIDGAYAYDGTSMWFMPIYPHEPFERTGAGDAFASTVTAEIAKGKTLAEALTMAPINSMSVTLFVGAQEGLLTQEKLDEYLKAAPADYKLRKI